MAPAFDPRYRHRQSLRLAGHDYAAPGAYFVTICAEHRASLFGDVVDHLFVPNEAGLVVESWWGNIERRFPSVLLGPYVVMPNHIHGIVLLGAVAGSDLPVHDEGGHIGPPLRTSGDTSPRMEFAIQFVGAARRGRPVSRPDAPVLSRPSLSEIIGWFKAMTTNDYGLGVRKYGWPPYRGRLWQRGFYDHVVRNQADLERIAQYIHDNPTRWCDDELNLRPA